MLDPEICAMKMGTRGSTQGETNESTPAEKARNGPPGPSRLRLELVRGPMEKASTGTAARMPNNRYKPRRASTGRPNTFWVAIVCECYLCSPLRTVWSALPERVLVGIGRGAIAGVVEAEEGEAGGSELFERTGLAAEQAFELLRLWALF